MRLSFLPKKVKKKTMKSMKMMMIVQVQFVALMVLQVALLSHHLESTGHLYQLTMELQKERVKYQATMRQNRSL